LRTDLGGVYFNALLITGMNLAYLYTQASWLFISIVVLHIETAIQFLSRKTNPPTSSRWTDASMESKIRQAGSMRRRPRRVSASTSGVGVNVELRGIPLPSGCDHNRGFAVTTLPALLSDMPP
jgi:hypothetical protein